EHADAGGDHDRDRSGGRRLDRRAGKHPPPHELRQGTDEGRQGRCPRGRHRRGLLLTGHHRGVPAVGVRRRHGRRDLRTVRRHQQPRARWVPDRGAHHHPGAVLLVPAAHGGRRQDPATDRAGDRRGRERTPMQRSYLPVIRWIPTKRKSATIFTLAATLLVFGGTVLMATNAETDWLGEAEENSYFVVQELEPGTSLDEADTEAEKVEELLAGMAWVDTYQTNIGSNPMMGGVGGGGGIDQIDYTITADPDTDQLRNRDLLREEFAELDTEFEPRLDSTGGMGGSDLEVQVTADDQNALAEAAGMVEEELKDIDGAEDVTSDISQGQPALEIHVDG